MHDVKKSYTPAPWRTGDHGTTIFGPKSDHPSPVIVATLPGPSPRVDARQRAGNRALIRLAPELYEMLIDVLILVEEAGDDQTLTGDGRAAMRTRARAIRRWVAEIDGAEETLGR